VRPASSTLKIFYIILFQNNVVFLNNKTRCFLIDLKHIKNWLLLPDLSYIIVDKFSCFSSHAFDACTRYPPEWTQQHRVSDAMRSINFFHNKNVHLFWKFETFFFMCDISTKRLILQRNNTIENNFDQII
jgi:hypothetical protein